MSKLSQMPAQPLRTPSGTLEHPQAFGNGFLFGIPVGDLGWFATLVLSFATGFAAFFAATFVAIMSILIYNSAGHHTVDFALSYKRIGMPIGLVVLAFVLTYLGSLWIRRQLRRA